MKITQVTFENDHWELLEEAAKESSLSVPNWLKAVSRLEAERQLAGRRTRSPGRPPGDKKLREIYGMILEIYKKLKEVWFDAPEAYETKFGPQLAEAKKLLEAKDLEGLESFYAARPWLPTSER